MEEVKQEAERIIELFKGIKSKDLGIPYEPLRADKTGLAKQCALICLDEKIQDNEIIENLNGSDLLTLANIYFHNQVKQYIKENY